MANIRIDCPTPISNGQAITFRSPADCSTVTGLIIYYNENNVNTSKTFQFADAHGYNVGGADLFVANVLVKVIIDTVNNKAYVQNASTSVYLEHRLEEKADIPTVSQTDITAGSTALASGKSYLVYE